MNTIFKILISLSFCHFALADIDLKDQMKSTSGVGNGSDEFYDTVEALREITSIALVEVQTVGIKSYSEVTQRHLQSDDVRTDIHYYLQNATILVPESGCFNIQNGKAVIASSFLDNEIPYICLSEELKGQSHTLIGATLIHEAIHFVINGISHQSASQIGHELLRLSPSYEVFQSSFKRDLLELSAQIGITGNLGLGLKLKDEHTYQFLNSYLRSDPTRSKLVIDKNNMDYNILLNFSLNEDKYNERNFLFSAALGQVSSGVPMNFFLYSFQEEKIKFIASGILLMPTLMYKKNMRKNDLTLTYNGSVNSLIVKDLTRDSSDLKFGAFINNYIRLNYNLSDTSYVFLQPQADIFVSNMASPRKSPIINQNSLRLGVSSDRIKVFISLEKTRKLQENESKGIHSLKGMGAEVSF